MPKILTITRLYAIAKYVNRALYSNHNSLQKHYSNKTKNIYEFFKKEKVKNEQMDQSKHQNASKKFMQLIQH